MRKHFILACIVTFLFSIFLISLFAAQVSADFSKGNVTDGIKATYAPSGVIKGWINISLQNESANSQLSTNFGNSISILDIIKKNNLTSSIICNPLSCQNKYEASGTGATEKSVLMQVEKKSLAFKINENIIGITSLSFSINSDSPSACTNQLQIDILADNEIDWQNTQTNYDFSCQKNHAKSG